MEVAQITLSNIQVLGISVGTLSTTIMLWGYMTKSFARKSDVEKVDLKVDNEKSRIDKLKDEQNSFVPRKESDRLERDLKDDIREIKEDVQIANDQNSKNFHQIIQLLSEQNAHIQWLRDQKDKP